MTKEETILPTLKLELKTANVTLLCGPVVFSRVRLKVSNGRPVNTKLYISSSSFISVLGVIVARHTMLTISMCVQWTGSDFGEETTRRLSSLVLLFILKLFFASVDNRCKICIGPKALQWSLFLRVIVIWTKFGIFRLRFLAFTWQKLKTPQVRWFQDCKYRWMSLLFGRGPNRVMETACFGAKVQ